MLMPKESVLSGARWEPGHGLTPIMDPGEEVWQLADRTGPSPKPCAVSSSKAPSSSPSPSPQNASSPVSVLQPGCIDPNARRILKRKAERERTGSSAPGNEKLRCEQVSNIG